MLLSSCVVWWSVFFRKTKKNQTRGRHMEYHKSLRVTGGGFFQNIFYFQTFLQNWVFDVSPICEIEFWFKIRADHVFYRAFSNRKTPKISKESPKNIRQVRPWVTMNHLWVSHTCQNLSHMVVWLTKRWFIMTSGTNESYAGATLSEVIKLQKAPTHDSFDSSQVFSIAK